MEAVAYDTAMLLLMAVQSADARNREALKDLLLNLGVHKGVTGPTSFSGDGDVVKNLHLIRVKGDNFVELENTLPVIRTDPPL